MSGENSVTGQVLGASTAVAGIATLPATGGNWVLMILPVLAITLGVVCLASFVITRFLKKVI